MAGIKEVFKTIGKTAISAAGLAGLPGASTVEKLFGLFERKGMSPQLKAELLRLKDENQQELAKIEAERDTRIAEAAGKIVLAEAQSQSTLARNVRPLCLLLVIIALLLNALLPLFVRLYLLATHPMEAEIVGVWMEAVKPLKLDDLLYYLAITGWGGYIVSRGAREFMQMRNQGR